MIDPKWNRWIFASLSKYFSDTLSNLPGLPQYKFHIEGVKMDTTGDVIAYRSTGPRWTQLTRTQWCGYIDVSILVRVMDDESDFHKIYKFVGPVEAAFTASIPIFQLGDGTGDNPNVSIDCMTLVSSPMGTIVTTHFGHVVPDLPSVQSTVDARYKIILVTPN